MLVVLALPSLVGILRTGGPLFTNYRVPPVSWCLSSMVFVSSATHLFPVCMHALLTSD